MAVVLVELLPVTIERGLDPELGANAILTGEPDVAHEDLQILVRLFETMLVEMLHVDHLDVLDHALAVGEGTAAKRTREVGLPVLRVDRHVLT